MDFVELIGGDHQVVLTRSDWEAMLTLAGKFGWKATGPKVLVFRPRNTQAFPTWAWPLSCGGGRQACASVAKALGTHLGTGVSRHRGRPPAWWNRHQPDRLADWARFTRQAWEAIYLLGGGDLTLLTLQDGENETCESKG